MNNTTLVILIAGSSRRFAGKVKKQFIKVDNKPIFIHTLINMLKFNFNNVVLVSAEEEIKNIKKYIEKEEFIKEKIKKNIHYIKGGSERVYSVYNAMSFLNEHKEDIKTDYVFIHDGVRPLVKKKEIALLYETVLKYDAAILASKVVDTVKKVDENNNIIETIDRTYLYRAATPQGFKFDNYMSAIEKYINDKNADLVTDDAEIYSKYFGNVKISECSSDNIKITNREDLDIFIKLR
ncbi:IspD/TarI family cytidylyltransferase [Brachyspira hyodysenteriae]|uniref:2-C-methyl-D-erythritol 4-phosphate cytidylyltransferase n=1 Tax=Brachyspira hyodysenteriae ATCC 27164 TaxID=1266923 RepID=A0A3B6VS59_BRAHO|nr:IspD/TarI family cytidylyltransferase [Brachyspira hyodysenteriae]ANN63846.1 2-C-methyl-D-erythritol 4-phosphate cytidylyltransferase [Brachyspira hyodysenteriae ATCC 27164]KLI16318.1 2-C-methyl-D-erythritol 4-phosphate cytidylyltransferase [Brachyspira hyodysenteriae]KLI22517.1 2-C-methyl-D-erythritol 4-phosphate cytidylyltransferase [Brachyspira hyodysenteriae]KLI30232.1 2-C-methyl-D-erythritol 4-phosphate cytidylyltransferase [Brachyspira hyodysenteriae]KLI56006.1 2-C-methyl-D-erythritol